MFNFTTTTDLQNNIIYNTRDKIVFYFVSGMFEEPGRKKCHVFIFIDEDLQMYFRLFIVQQSSHLSTILC